METIQLNKSRSIKACIVDAWHVFALDWRKYLKSVAIPALTAGMAGAFVFEMFLQYVCQHVLPAYRLYQAGGDSEWIKMLIIPSWGELLFLILSLFILLFFAASYKGKLLGLINHYADYGVFTDKKMITLTAKERSFAVRNILDKIIFFILFALLAGLIVWAAIKCQKRILYLLPLLLVYFWTTGNVTRLQYTLGRDKFLQAIKNGLKKSMGHAFIVQVLTLIPMLLLYLVFLLPACVYALSSLAAQDSLLVGDEISVPTYLPLVFFLFNTVGIAALLLFNSVRTWSLTMKLNFFEKKDTEVIASDSSESK